MKNEYKAYLERMNRFNEWEQQRNLEHTKDTATSVKEHLALMELDHQLIPEDKKEQLRKEKIKMWKDTVRRYSSPLAITNGKEKINKTLD